MKIFMIANMYPSKRYPSYGVFVKNHLEMLEVLGFHVDKLVMKKRMSKFFKSLAYLSFYLRIICKLLFQKQAVLYIHYASHVAWLICLIKKWKPELRIIVNLHGSDVFPETKLQQNLQNQVKKLVQQAEKVVVPSAYFETVVMQKYTISQEKIFISPSGGINLAIFKPKKLGNDKRETRQEILLGYVGRIDVGKGWEDVLRAFTALKKAGTARWKLIMIGSGKEDEKKQSLAEELHIQSDVEFRPLIPQHDLPNYYRKFDCFLFPTRRKGESLGLVGLEAMACGTPVIGSQIAGLESYLENGKNGFFYPPGDVGALISVLNQFAQLSEEQVSMLSKEAILTAEKYDRRLVKRNFESFMIGFMGENKKAPARLS
ncbi:glycosyltransferase family 4 protein [Listeria kieliensis]|uniref:Glycosyl transferase family 1 domain-containing protein n=1 Tax=Listeria kieliensis TaxID=1621700 RepID=A0A3D8TRY3_9LIST|nr:glycosyltransferase family 4 protein [Listeria kieliensis]RDX01513.1 hypothetical protein UR08_07650 [Listeria kieliensis]